MDYRHEYKFWVPDLTIMKLRQRLEPLMRYDDNQGDDFYKIKSLYFDDYYDTCLQENEAGVDNRRKYRIRYYNENLEYINLEKKSKLRGMTRKESEMLSADEVRAYIAGENDLLRGDVTTELYLRQQKSGMRPKCIVEYDRLALVEDAGNVRITFDMNIRGSSDIDRFLDNDSDYMVPAMEPGYHVLEVKYDEFLPTYIRQAVDINSLHRQSVSKYALVRKAITRGGF